MIAAPATAAGAEKKGGSSKVSNKFQANWQTEDKESTKEAVDTKKAGKAVDIPMVVLPLMHRGYLSNYAYVSVRINLGEGQDAWALRGKSHFLKDAIIRKSHTKKDALLDLESNNGAQLDQSNLESLILSAIEPWILQGSIDSIEFLKIDLQK